MPADLTVVIPHYNDVARLARCLEALMAQMDASMQVIVADNGSSESLDPLRNRWPDMCIVEQSEKGAGPARNAGAAAAETDWLAFLDADCVPAADWVAAARRVAAKGTVLGGVVTVFDETEPPRSGAEAFETVFAFQVGRYLDKGFLPSCQLIMARADFERVGGFRVGVSEDVDWSRRAIAKGLGLELSEELRISHPSRSDWPSLRHKWQRLTSEGFLLDGQRAAGRVRWAARAVLMPVSVLVHAPRVLRHPDLTLAEKARAVITLIRLRVLRMIWMLGQAATGRT